MGELYDFSREIQSKLNDGKYEEALQYYKDNYKNFEREEIAKNEYIVSDIIRCLRKLNKFKQAKQYLDSLDIPIDNTTPKRVLDSYGWVLYDSLKNKDNNIIHDEEDNDVITGLGDEHYNEVNIFDNTDPLHEELKVILPLLEFNSKYSPFSKLLSATLKKEKKKQNCNWRYINELLSDIPIDELSTNCESFEANVKGRQKTIELASDKDPGMLINQKRC